MTEWTPEEEAVARAIADEQYGGPFPIGQRETATKAWLDENWPDYLDVARAAIAAMQPRWRDVRTDPPPRDGTEFDVWNGYERVVDVFWSAKRQAWCRREYETNHGDVEWTVMPFSHWMIVTPPLPPAPEPKP